MTLPKLYRSAYFSEEVEQQATAFNNLLQKLGKTTPEQVKTVLEERDIVAPEPELNAEIIAKFRQKTS